MGTIDLDPSAERVMVVIAMARIAVVIAKVQLVNLLIEQPVQNLLPMAAITTIQKEVVVEADQVVSEVVDQVVMMVVMEAYQVVLEVVVQVVMMVVEGLEIPKIRIGSIA